MTSPRNHSTLLRANLAAVCAVGVVAVVAAAGSTATAAPRPAAATVSPEVAYLAGQINGQAKVEQGLLAKADTARHLNQAATLRALLAELRVVQTRLSYNTARLTVLTRP